MTDCCLANPSALFKHSGKFQRSLAQCSAEAADLALSRRADLPEAQNCSSQKSSIWEIRDRLGGVNTSKLHPKGNAVCPYQPQRAS